MEWTTFIIQLAGVTTLAFLVLAVAYGFATMIFSDRDQPRSLRQKIRDAILYKTVRYPEDCPLCDGGGRTEAHNPVFGTIEVDCSNCGGDGYTIETQKVRRFGREE